MNAQRVPVNRVKVAYGDSPSNFGHIYHAAGTGADERRMRPIVLIHGGYWSAEFSLTIQSAIARQYAELGALVWSIEYRRVGEPGGGWPGTGRDAVAAIKALDDLVPEALDPLVAGRVDWSQVAVVGHSAGGQLAVWSTAQLRARTRNTTISTVVAQSAALNLEAAARSGSESVLALVGRPYEEAPHLYREASPWAQEPFDAHVVAIHAADDTTIPPIVSRRYVDRMTERGQSAELVEVPDEGHSAFCDPRSRANRETARVLGI
ncbi:alpha/beta hydrolase [Gordonia sp. (in: high G+C Gram-positive bacteria)]|uniref:alpha/beta hydrolase family protein n=1 Tax=Gordonia sp. (in: high G+C Gram-positive bacteria) TaxID=84139 RepID=UPI001D919EEC|nr:alpha/beta hydrolase [Gordonia sp. (in: high G+C Gram-positive bacteria)]MCB1295775.1 alpha/beta hydrolase [Gordonia sp. (in: high G+C Gram-positive bacteria)]HMS75055.1 alpha/beta hydrolase [Gordonia sp. (in: high G+C Gram-positive bacteria)]